MLLLVGRLSFSLRSPSSEYVHTKRRVTSTTQRLDSAEIQPAQLRTVSWYASLPVLRILLPPSRLRPPRQVLLVPLILVSVHGTLRKVTEGTDLTYFRGARRDMVCSAVDTPDRIAWHPGFEPLH